MSLPAFLLLTDTVENRTLCRARALSKREAFVASGRGRRQAAEAGADLRSKDADSPRNAPARYRCDADRASYPGLNPSTDPPHPWRIELYAGRGRKENALATQTGTRFPNGGPGGKSIPESRLRLGRSFRMAPQAETASRDLSSEWDSFSGWRAQRKMRPGICSENGTHFPLHLPPQKTCAPSIPKLGRRRPKCNRRRSI